MNIKIPITIPTLSDYQNPITNPTLSDCQDPITNPTLSDSESYHLRYPKWLSHGSEANLNKKQKKDSSPDIKVEYKSDII